MSSTQKTLLSIFSILSVVFSAVFPVHAELSSMHQRYNSLLALYNQKQYQSVLQNVQADLDWSNALEPEHRLNLYKVAAYSAVNIQNYSQASRFLQLAYTLSTKLNGINHPESLTIESHRLIQSDIHKLLTPKQLIPQYELLRNRLKTYAPSHSNLRAIENNLMVHYEATGLSFMRQAAYQESLNWLLKAYRVNPNNGLTKEEAVLAIHLSQAYFYLGQKQEALAYYQIAKKAYAVHSIPLSPKQNQDLVELGQNLQALDNKTEYVSNIEENKNFRWQQGTQFITVYFKPGRTQDGWKPENIDIVKRAFQTWENSGSIPFRYRYTEDPANTDITVQWVFDRPVETDPNSLGLCAHRTFNDKLIALDITLALHNPHHDKPLLANNYLYAIALHEIGHSLGITGHSTNPQDVMYKSSYVERLSPRDLQTVVALYQREALAYNVPGVYITQIHRYATHLKQAEKMLNQKLYTEAEKELAKSRLAYPESGGHEQYLRGYIAFNQKKYKEAEVLLTTLKDKNKSGLNYITGLTYTYLWENSVVASSFSLRKVLAVKNAQASGLLLFKCSFKGARQFSLLKTENKGSVELS